MGAEDLGSRLAVAASAANETEVSALLARGAPVDGAPGATDTPLFLACRSDAPRHQRLSTAKLLIDRGAFVRAACEGGATALHMAAQHGPAELVELLLNSGALHWQGDAHGHTAFEYARSGPKAERDQIVAMCSPGPHISDPDFCDAVRAIHTGDLERLKVLLDKHPRLPGMRAIEPNLPPKGYFSDPKLLWFVANNPTLMNPPPRNLIEIANTIIDQGVDRSDLDYTLELAISSGTLGDFQLPLIETLTRRGARPTKTAILIALGHQQLEAVRWLVADGLDLTAAIAAGLGQLDRLPVLLQEASADEKSEAVDMAVINQESDAVLMGLQAGVDPNHFMVVHAHSTPAHQAAWNDDVATLKLLIAGGARLDVRDQLWMGTPIEWARFGGRSRAAAFLNGILD